MNCMAARAMEVPERTHLQGFGILIDQMAWASEGFWLDRIKHMRVLPYKVARTVSNSANDYCRGHENCGLPPM